MLTHTNVHHPRKLLTRICKWYFCLWTRVDCAWTRILTATIELSALRETKALFSYSLVYLVPEPATQCSLPNNSFNEFDSNSLSGYSPHFACVLLYWRPAHTKRKQHFLWCLPLICLISSNCSLIFFAFAFAFASCEQALRSISLSPLKADHSVN